jgi:hypothetical protein
MQKGIWFFSKLERPTLSRILDLPRRKRWIDRARERLCRAIARDFTKAL